MTKHEQESKQVKIKNAQGRVVGHINLTDGRLNGRCEWFSSRGEQVALGDFRDGKPFTGTFLNFSLYYPAAAQNPYDAKLYAKDWITVFENTFLSQEPNYLIVTEVYDQGKKKTR